MLTLETLDFLTSDAGGRLLETLAAQDLSANHTLTLLTRLRKTHPADHAAAALETARLRQRAVEKFGADASRLFFTADALEQASDPLIRAYRAQAAPESVLDIGCGIGADSLAFAAQGARVTGMDLDPLRVALAQANADALGLDARFRVGDAREPLPVDAALRFFDPARRDASGRRLNHVESYQPPLSTITGWGQRPIMVKLSPAVDLTQLEPYGGAVTFFSSGGDLKEAVLHLHSDHSGLEAVLLTPESAHVWRRTGDAPVERALSAPRGWLLEPDAALLRAGLVQDVAHALEAYQLDATIAYLTSDARPDTPWARAWQIEAWMPFNVKKLRAYLRERGVGTLTVKKRGSPLTPEQLISQVKPKGDASRTLVLTRHQGAPIVIICADYVPP